MLEKIILNNEGDEDSVVVTLEVSCEKDEQVLQAVNHLDLLKREEGSTVRLTFEVRPDCDLGDFQEALVALSMKSLEACSFMLLIRRALLQPENPVSYTWAPLL